MNSEFNDIARPIERFAGLDPYNGGNFGADPLISGSKRSITQNNQYIEDTYDGNFHIESLLPYAVITASLLILVYKNV
jgi:hypothetical protein